MTTKPIKPAKLTTPGEAGAKSALKRLFHKIARYFDAPPAATPTLPEAILAKIGIASWPVASLLIGGGIYLVFFIIAYLDGIAANLNHSNGWWRSLVFPAMIAYLLLAQPLLRRLLTQTIQAFRALAPFNDRFRRLEYEAYALNRRHEWLALSLGLLAGWLIFFFFRQELPRARLIYTAIGDMLVYGLLGWHIYSVLIRTRILTTMHSQVQEFNIFKEPPPVKPILRWNLGVSGFLLGAILVSIIFVPPDELYNPTILLVYIVLGLAALLVFVFSRAPTSLIGQFRILRALFLFLFVAAVGTVGFSRLEDWKLSDAFYATIITMTTVGYGDFSPATPEGRLFTIFLSLFAIGIGGYAITSLASLIIEGNFHRFIQGKRVDKQIVRMKDHYILCGAGRMGKQIAVEFYKSELPFVVIEQSPIVLEALLRETEIPYVQGDATQDEVLRLAGVERARGLLAVVSDDKNNVFIVLSARSLNPRLRIVSRVSQEKNRKKLQKAGANVIISPDEVSGRRMVSEMFHSEVVTLLDEMLRAEEQTGQTLRLEELHVDEIKLPALLERLEAGQLSIRDIGQRTELMVVAIKRGQVAAEEDLYIYTPRGDAQLQPGDILIVISTPEQRLKLRHDVLSQSSLSTWMAKIWT